MIYGNRQRFAIEHELDSDSRGKWMIGRLCYWVSGQRVGDYNELTSLADALLGLDAISHDRGRRKNSALASLATNTLCELLNETLFGDSLNETLIQRANDELWAAHLVKPGVDVFDGWHVYLVEYDNRGRLVCNDYTRGAYFDTRLAYGEFDQVLSAALVPLYEEFDRTRPATL